MDKENREQFFNELLYYQHEDVIFYLDDEDYPLGMRCPEDFNIILFCRQFKKEVWNLRAEFLDGTEGVMYFSIDTSAYPQYERPQAYLLCEAWAEEMLDKFEKDTEL